MGSELVDWLTAGGTVGAAAFAGWAAWSSGAAARQTRRLVEIEAGRDLERAEAERIAQARRVSVTLMTEELLDAGRQAGVDFHLVAVNASDSPVFKVRIGVVAGDGAWGPQLCGNLVPGQQVELYARIYTTASLDNTDASIRFVDVNDRAWVATARAPAEPTSADPAEWIAKGSDFAQRELDLYERGMWNGPATPDFDDWRAGVHQRSLEAE